MERTEQTATAAATASGKAPQRRGPVVAALMMAMALAAMDSTIISTAVPQIVDYMIHIQSQPEQGR